MSLRIWLYIGLLWWQAARCATRHPPSRTERAEGPGFPPRHAERAGDPGLPPRHAERAGDPGLWPEIESLRRYGNELRFSVRGMRRMERNAGGLFRRHFSKLLVRLPGLLQAERAARDVGQVLGRVYDSRRVGVTAGCRLSRAIPVPARPQPIDRPCT